MAGESPSQSAEGRSEGSPPPLVLVHGAGGTHLHWPPRLRRLPQVDVYGLDLPGHGHSEGSGRQSISAYADVVRSLGRRSRNRPVRVWPGTPWVEAIALDVALRHAHLLAGLILVGTGARLRVHPGILSGVTSDFASTAKQITALAYGQADARPVGQRQAAPALSAGTAGG